VSDSHDRILTAPAGSQPTQQSRGEPYTDLGADYFVKRQAHQAYRDRLVRQLERMGHKVTLEPTAA